MKKLFILAIVVSFTTTAMAQLGITGGITSASVNFKEDQGAGFDTKSTIGFTLGLYTHVPLSTNIIFRPGLNFTQKGAKLEFTFGGTTDETKAVFNYLELPLDFIYRATGGFFVGAGPSLAYLLSGKFKEDGQPDYKLKIGNDENNDDIKAFEFGGNLLAGYTMSSGLSFSVNYNLGLSNLNPTTDKDEDFKNRYVGLRLGYNFGNKSAKKK